MRNQLNNYLSTPTRLQSFVRETAVAKTSVFHTIALINPSFTKTGNKLFKR